MPPPRARRPHMQQHSHRWRLSPPIPIMARNRALGRLKPQMDGPGLPQDATLAIDPRTLGEDQNVVDDHVADLDRGDIGGDDARPEFGGGFEYRLL